MKVFNFQKKSNSFFYIRSLYLIINLFTFVNSKYIIIPLTKYKFDFDNEENILSKISSNIYYTKLSVGEPSQKIASFINTSSISNFGIMNKFCDKKFYMNNSSINKDYLYKNSSKFNNTKNENMIIGTKDILITDQIKFYTNFELSNEIVVDNISILYNPNNEGYIIDDVGIDFIIEREKKTTCAYIGFQLGFQRNNIYNNLLEQLKRKKIITNTVFSFMEINKDNEFYEKNNVDYLLIIGEEIYDIVNIEGVDKYISDKYNKNKFLEKNKLNDYVINEGYYYFVWKITCSNIYIKINNDNIYLEQIEDVYFDHDYGLIKGTGEYRNIIEQKFFNNYINISKCSKVLLRKENLDETFYYYECDKDINTNNFPALFFKSKILQYEYLLTKEDLFILDKNKLYFLIVFPLKNTNSWKLGKPFLDKYLFSYNYEARTISFYNENLLSKEVDNTNNNGDSKKIFIIILIVLLSLIALILGFFYGRNIFKKKRKHKAYELKSESESDNKLIEDNNEENQGKKENFSINL